MKYILDKVLRDRLEKIGTEGINVVVDTEYGKMIVNRHDTIRGKLLIATGKPDDHADITMLVSILDVLPPNAIVLDIGANFGTHTLAFAKRAGKVFAFEPQRAIFNILAGNVALNSLFNVFCYPLAVSDKAGSVEMPQFDYTLPADFGSVEFGSAQLTSIGQPRIRKEEVEYVQAVTIDNFNFPKVDMIKIDVEGMEQQVLDGAANTIKTHLPVLFIEHSKSNKEKLIEWIEALGYKTYINGMNLLGIPAKLKDTIHVTSQ